ncbi:hypothetical protein C9374_007443 [Naegleria lovaniensis]|uniref:beta-glucosidase n=1 Tax=Naegleria lovaniensis TaxID=51637 RepID=A0AA88KLU6_NAELO|nr:uncharacterized protein C9374_007443 [Naegleria lovaniensis]KAG2379304.1 hypothetical protein C9374_007443 [Naegleria lovaniensis]
MVFNDHNLSLLFVFKTSIEKNILQQPRILFNLPSQPTDHNMESIIPFPPDFKFGTATAAYQIEGAFNQDGRGLSVWDQFAHTFGKTHNGDHGDTACDHYHRMEQDTDLLFDELGIKNYRMSISWTRLLPNGLLSGGINEKGVEYYNREINYLISKGVNVVITLFHWDYPQYLQDQFQGWLSKEEAISAFRDYAELCFKLFGDRVKCWITLNEPAVVAWYGYGMGTAAPGRSSSNGGNSSTEPYLVAHHQLLAHAHAVHIYRTKYQQEQKGKMGITVNSSYYQPLDENNPLDVQAAETQQVFKLGWFLDPVVFGDYPQIMKDRVKERLPEFSSEEKHLLKQSFDFIGLNHYTTRYVTTFSRHENETSTSNETKSQDSTQEKTWHTDAGGKIVMEKNGQLIGEQAESAWINVVPWGIRKILNWISQRYHDPEIYITENGVSVPNEHSLPLSQALHDTFRVNYLQQYLKQVSLAVMEDHVNVKAYFVWSFMDNFEWADGYSKRFGLIHVDYNGEHGEKLKRYVKDSAKWYSKQIQNFN